MTSSKNNLSGKGHDDFNEDDENEPKTSRDIVPDLFPVHDDSSEKPCCSKSLPNHHPHHYNQFSLKQADGKGIKFRDGSCVKTEIITDRHLNPRKNEEPPPLTPLSASIHSTSPHTRNDDNDDERAIDAHADTPSTVSHRTTIPQALSDTVLALPRLPDFAHDEKNDELDKAVQNYFTDDVLLKEQMEYPLERENEVSKKPPTMNLEKIVQSDQNNNEDVRFPIEDDKDGYWIKMDKNYELNENEKVLVWPTEAENKLIKSVSYLFHEDRREELHRLVGLLPRGREFVVFNVFSDLFRVFGYKKRNKHVKFPEEFLEKYEQQGDVAGKDRFVPSAKQPYNKGMQGKKRKLSAVYSTWTVKSSEFEPRVDRVDDTTACEYRCERYFLSCDCCRSLNKKEKSNVTSVTDGYTSDLNLANVFLHAHATRTFESAMSNLEFVKFHDDDRRPLDAGPTPWVMNYAKQHLGVLSGSVWVFTYCIRCIVQQSRNRDLLGKTPSVVPSENSFKKTLEQFAAMCLTLSENVKVVLQQSQNFYNFIKECARVIKVLQIHVGFKGNIQFKKPLRRGDGLDINRTMKQKEVTAQAGIEVIVAKFKPRDAQLHTLISEASSGSADKGETGAAKEEEVLEWKSFEEMPGNEKGIFLRNLLNITTVGMNLVLTQLRFLMDDIMEGVKDSTTTDSDLLYLLSDMYDRIKFLENLGKKNVKGELEQISRNMTEFCKDFQSFVDYGQHIMKRFIELQDMVHLSYEYMLQGLKLETLSEMVPATTFKKKWSVTGCCCCKSRPRGRASTPRLKRVVNYHFPKYKVSDFFRVYFKDMVKSKAEIQTDKFILHIDLSSTVIKSIVPMDCDTTWGDIGSPRSSFDEYMDKTEDDDDSNEELGGGEKVDAPYIKPILVGAEMSTPRGSIDGSNAPSVIDGRTSSPPRKGSAGSESGSHK